MPRASSDDYTGSMRERPASADEILAFETASGLDLPDAYLSFLRCSNRGEGELDIEPGWFQIWPASAVVELNHLYEVKDALPGFFAFGSNGGGEMLAFRIVGPEPWPVYMIPFITMEESDAVRIADTFKEFMQAMGRSIQGA